MAVKRIGFLDNFTSGGGYVRSGPRAGGAYYQSVGERQNRARYGRNTGLNARSEALNKQYQLGAYAPPPKVTPAAPPVASAPVKPAAEPAARVQLDDPEILSDPMLLRVKKLQETRRGDVRAGALARKKELAIQTGSDVLAREFGLDDTVAQTAARNPLSAFAALREAARLEERDLEEGLNKANLHFGGYRGTQLGELAQSLLAREANEQARARQAFSGIEDNMLAGLSEADRLEMEAETAAYERAVARRAAGLGGSEGTPPPAPPGDNPLGPGAGPNMPHPHLPFTETNPSFGSGRDALLAELMEIDAARKLQPKRVDPLLAELLRGSGGRRFAV